MKHFQNFITEARQQAPTKIYFNSMSAYFLFLYELEGQISDGYWENSRPMSHWNWITNLEYVVDSNADPGYEGPKHRIKYSTKWMIDDLNNWIKKGEKDWKWTTRFLNFGKLGLLIDQSQAKKFEDESYRYIIESLPEEPITVKGFESGLRDYQKKYWDKVKGDLNAAFFKKWYKTDYTIRDLKADLMDVEESMNTQL